MPSSAPVVELPLVAGEDANGFGCEWNKLHADGKESSFQFMTTSAEQWNVRLAIQWAIAEAAGGKVDQPLVIKDTKGGEHVVANPGDKIVTNFVDGRFAEGRRVLRRRSCRSRRATAPA